MAGRPTNPDGENSLCYEALQRCNTQGAYLVYNREVHTSGFLGPCPEGKGRRPCDAAKVCFWRQFCFSVVRSGAVNKIPWRHSHLRPMLRPPRTPHLGATPRRTTRSRREKSPFAHPLPPIRTLSL